MEEHRQRYIYFDDHDNEISFQIWNSNKKVIESMSISNLTYNWSSSLYTVCAVAEMNCCTNALKQLQWLYYLTSALGAPIGPSTRELYIPADQDDVYAVVLCGTKLPKMRVPHSIRMIDKMLSTMMCIASHEIVKLRKCAALTNKEVLRQSLTQQPACITYQQEWRALVSSMLELLRSSFPSVKPDGWENVLRFGQGYREYCLLVIFSLIGIPDLFTDRYWYCKRNHEEPCQRVTDLQSYFREKLCDVMKLAQQQKPEEFIRDRYIRDVFAGICRK